MKKETTNIFSEGLNYDLNPNVTPSNVLTDSVNGTFVTFNGDELSLQNDAGNTKIPVPKANPNDPNEYVELTEGFYPLGVKESGGVLYIVSGKAPEITNFTTGNTYEKNSFIYNSNKYYRSLVLNSNVQTLPNTSNNNWEIIESWNDLVNKYGEIEFGSYPSPKDAELGIIETKEISLNPTSNYSLGDRIILSDNGLSNALSISFTANTSIDVSNVSFKDINGNYHKKVYKVKLLQITDSSIIDLTDDVERQYLEFRKKKDINLLSTILAQSISYGSTLKSSLAVNSVEGFPNSGFVTIKLPNLNGDTTFVFKYTSKNTDTNTFINDDIIEEYFYFDSNSGIVVDQTANYWFADPRFKYLLSSKKGYLSISIELEDVKIWIDNDFVSKYTSTIKADAISQISLNYPKVPSTGNLILGDSLIKIPYTSVTYNDTNQTQILTLKIPFRTPRRFEKNYQVYVESSSNFYLYTDPSDNIGYLHVKWFPNENYPANLEEGYGIIKGSYYQTPSNLDYNYSAVDELFKYTSIVRQGTSDIYIITLSSDTDFKHKHIDWTWSAGTEYASIITENLNNESSFWRPAAVSYAVVTTLAQDLGTKRYMEIPTFKDAKGLISFPDCSLILTGDFNQGKIYIYGTWINDMCVFNYFLPYTPNPVEYVIKPSIEFLRSDEFVINFLDDENLSEDFKKNLTIAGKFTLPEDNIEDDGWYLSLDKFQQIGSLITYFQISIRQLKNGFEYYINSDGESNLNTKSVLIVEGYDSDREYGTIVADYIKFVDNEWILSEILPTSSIFKERVSKLLSDTILQFGESGSSQQLHITTTLPIGIDYDISNIEVKQNGVKLTRDGLQILTTTHNYTVLSDVPINIKIIRTGFDTIYYTTTLTSETTLNFGLVASINGSVEYIPGVNYYWSFSFAYNESGINTDNNIKFITNTVQGISGSSIDLGKIVTLYWNNGNYSISQGSGTIYAGVDLVPNYPTLTGTYNNITNNSNYVQVVNSTGTKVIFKKSNIFTI